MAGKTRPEDEAHGQAAAAAGGKQAPMGQGAGSDGQALETNAGQPATSDSGADALGKLEAENASLKDRLLRALAETENVRRRGERDVKDARQYAIAKFAGDMLHVADNLERAIASIPAELRRGEGAAKTLIEGVELTEKELQRSLERHGVKKLNTMGERFDPNFHEAMFEVPDRSVPNGTVMKVVAPGYKIGSRPLRPAKVGVTSGGAQGRPLGPDGEPEG